MQPKNRSQSHDLAGVRNIHMGLSFSGTDCLCDMGPGPGSEEEEEEEGVNYINPKQINLWQALKGCGKLLETDLTIASPNLSL